MHKIIFIIIFSNLLFSENSSIINETIYLKNGTIIKGLVIEKNENGIITVQSGTNIFNFNYNDVMKIEKQSKKTTSNKEEETHISKNKKLEAARAYLEETRKNINTKTNKSFYYMATGGIANEEYYGNGIAISLLGFYAPINNKVLLGFNQTAYAKDVSDVGCNDWDDYCDIWFYRRLYAFSYLEFDKKIGEGLFWRVDFGYANREFMDIDIFESYVRSNGTGLLVGVGYGWDNSNSNLLLEFDYHIDFYGGDSVDWFALTIGGLF